MSLIILGSINTDLVIRGPKLPRPGETVTGGRFFQSAGGKGANQAVAAARAGQVPVVFLGAVGDDPFGKQHVERLTAERICCRWVRTIPGSATGVALILVDARGENLISVAGGANLDLTAADVDLVADEVFAQATVFLASLESPLEAVQRGLARARAAGHRTILNPAPAPAPEQAEPLWRLADVLTPNEHELAVLAGMEVDSAQDAVAAARQLQSRGAQDVVATLGAQGCVVVAGQSPPLVVPAMQVEAVDATAAGDAFSGALAVGLAEGKSLADAARFATSAAGIAVTRSGAQPSLARREEIDRVLCMSAMSAHSESAPFRLP